MSELVIAEKSDLTGIADEVRQLTGQTKSLSLQEMQTGLKSIDNQPDWTQNDQTARDYVKNRPGGYTVNYPALNIEWDGVIGDRVSVDYGNMKLVKVSDEIPKAEQLVGGTLSVKQGDMSDAISITDKIIDNLGNGNYIFEGGGVSVNKAPANLVDPNTGTVAVVLPETGVYFIYVSHHAIIMYTSSLTLPAKSVIVPIPGELTNIVGGYVREEEGKEPLVDAVVLAGCFKLYEGDK